MHARTVDLPYLYHTTALNLEDEFTARNYAERPDAYPHWVLPEPGRFSTNLRDHKWFTVTAASSYAELDPWERWAFLRYKVTRPLRLLDVRREPDDSPLYQEVRNPKSALYQNRELDGYVGRGTEDLTEIMLLRPEEVVEDTYKLMPYVPVSIGTAPGAVYAQLLRYENDILGGGLGETDFADQHRLDAWWGRKSHETSIAELYFELGDRSHQVCLTQEVLDYLKAL